MPDPEPDDLVAYDLADWGPDLRAQLDELLSKDGVTAAWEEDELVVAETDADTVEALIDAVESPDALAVEEEADGSGGEDVAGHVQRRERGRPVLAARRLRDLLRPLV